MTLRREDSDKCGADHPTADVYCTELPHCADAPHVCGGYHWYGDLVPEWATVFDASLARVEAIDRAMELIRDAGSAVKLCAPHPLNVEEMHHALEAEWKKLRAWRDEMLGRLHDEERWQQVNQPQDEAEGD